MEQTTLQKRIEERAEQRLLRDMYDAFKKQGEIQSLVGPENYPTSFYMECIYKSYKRPNEITCYDDRSKEIFQKLLPKYIDMVTNEILNEIDQIRNLVERVEPVTEEY